MGGRPGARSTLAIPDAAERVGWVLRLALLLLVSMLVLATTKDARSLVWVGLLAVAALPAFAPARYPLLPPLGRLAEVVVTALGASTLAAYPGAPASALLPYLTVPVILPALAGRLRESLILLAIAAGLLTLSGAYDGLLGDPTYLLSILEWLAIAGLSAAFVHSVQRRLGSTVDAPQPYAEATRLLTQLRTVARQLPGATLDPGGIAEHLIEELRLIAPVDRCAVLSGSGGGRLVVLAQFGAERVDWETSLDADSAIADAWATQQTQVSGRSQSRSTAAPGSEVSSLVLPLVSGIRTVGLVALEAGKAGAYPPAVVARAAAVATPAAFRLEAALLFDDVRSLATNEERQRLAREIHDGVAQELVMVGYGIDNALATLPDEATVTAEDLRLLRSEVTRVITELRLSLFELRADVERQGGLTAAISEYARTVGAAGGMRVNLTMVDSTARLPTSVEAELYRIAQEAITNARKHAGAQNLWVSCEIDPPYARIEIADDGAGIGPHRTEGRLGLAIMAERAERIRGQLEITPRGSGGTSVAVVLGTAHRRSTP